ncbi:TonB-linked outer membrane protein, SusC/RagA family [bacterium A37T11]|nr:TonB-linked outer membrane protein, SusC/RagA family [bacterium A37T11]
MYKKITDKDAMPLQLHQKILRVMKITTLLLFIICIQVSARSFAQQITFVKKKATFVEIFQEINKQTDYNVFWSPGLLRGVKPVDVSFKNTTVTDALRQVLTKQGLDFSIEDHTVLISALQKSLVAIQPKTLHGIITSENGEPLMSASVKLQGTNKEVLSNRLGEFNIDASVDDIIQISFVGYETKSYKVRSENNIRIILVPISSELDQVVVIGYGTQKKADLTGAVGAVNVEKALNSRPVTNVQELLAGSIPGLNVSKSSGAVGSGASLNIRGTSTIGGSSGVLVLIDGFPGNIYTLNYNDIESVSVLKDASSAAIYGSRAANGVALITTKKGKSAGKAQIELTSSVGFQKPQFLVDYVGAADYMKLWDQALVNDGKDPLYGQQGLDDLASGKYSDNKWYKDIYKKSTAITDHSLSVAGGNDVITYRLSGAYDYQDGTLPTNNYSKYLIRPNMNMKLSDKISVDANIQYTETYILQPEKGTENWQSEATRAAPINPIYTPSGQYAIGSSIVGNPVAAVNEGGYNKSRYKELFGVLSLNYSPLKDWNIKGSFSRYTYDQRTTARVSSYNLYNDDGSIAAQKNIVTGIQETLNSQWRNTLQATTDYFYNLNKHHFKVLGGYSQEYYKTEGFNAYRDNLPFDDIDVLDVGSASNMQNGGSASDVAIQSFFGRLNYDFDEKYLFQANIRSDGSSRFGDGHKWGTFPSFSAGWNIHKESFFKVNWISQLKLRASWGILGDAEKVGYYATAQTLTYNPSIYGFGGSVVAGAYNSLAIDPNITWERSKQTDIGLDAGLFDQKISLGVDYFYNKRDNILYAPPVSVEFGLSGPVRNLLKMDNKGWEFSAGYEDRISDFNWGISMNLAFSKNKVTDLGGTGPWIASNSYSDVGTQYQMSYGLISTGLFKDDADVASVDQGSNIFPGNIKYKDLDDNSVIDGNDRAVLNDKVPLNYGSALHFGWKQFDISANIYGKLNYYGYAESVAFAASQNARPWALDNWTPDNLDATYPRLSSQYTSNDTKYSSYWLKKADYLKIQNMQMGYIFSTNLLNKININYLRIFISVQNLATITGYPGFDPEGGVYPLSRTYSFGVNVKF